ncbi:hypothetical protein EVAR_41830_1 [Eumeta japonica]|uniref:Uncharacterized protein n=1 Tax=Eumeta variegata TaxID=151549 RepID=A0A4C1XAM6_EUMVA|nr:hypothetical protein EVAR_41830_1 [Eumeta japonica]
MSHEKTPGAALLQVASPQTTPARGSGTFDASGDRRRETGPLADMEICACVQSHVAQNPVSSFRVWHNSGVGRRLAELSCACARRGDIRRLIVRFNASCALASNIERKQ